ncbi:TRAP transporter small permease subunit [Enterovirga rhinocerotis]|uniref:TRAP transporter small permease protein n=1 Tax=Enterovirga rhinocerotis TaxID=1339210 RepID=A0A4R7C440_9HYPH|nr:TRAP transporter small permease subunit [Enterovirga rhinocerotis]TDR93234.1 TRAP-type mannitol/chloroaromatic compound transport system permease small subunit [Enterovirga rhinocerotis]
MKSTILRVIGVIDRVTAFTGYVLALLIVPLVGAGVFEVVARYVFNAPTNWAADVSVMSSSTIFMVGAAYALLKGAHIRTDLLWDNFSDRTKGAIDAVAYLLLFLPVMAVLFFISVDDALYAYQIGETSQLGLWRPVLWPFRAMIPLAAALLFFQGISEVLKALWQWKTGIVLTHHEKIEI